MTIDTFRPGRRAGGAPKGNKNASKRPAESLMRVVAEMLTDGRMTRSQAAKHLGVGYSTACKWFSAGKP